MNKYQVTIDYLYVEFIELHKTYRLDVDYRVTVKEWSDVQQFNLRMHLTSKGTSDDEPVTGQSDEKPLGWCVPLDFPTTHRRDDAKWDSTFRVRIDKKQFAGKPKDFKFYAIVTDTEGAPVSKPKTRSYIRFKGLKKDHKVRPLESTIGKRRGLLVILPGIMGENFDLTRIKNRIASTSTKKPNTGLAAQIWNWIELAEIDSLALRDRARVSEETKAAASLFADEVIDWRNNPLHKDKKLYLLCGSGGASIALLAADYLKDKQGKKDKPIFERVVFASAAVDTKRPLAPLTKISGSLYNYYSYNDYTLVGIIASFFGTFKFALAWPAAGRFGYRNKGNTPEKLRQLGWRKLDKDELDNRGAHLKCYEPEYFEKFFLPLFCENAKIPKRWIRGIDKKHYDQVQSYEPRKCEY